MRIQLILIIMASLGLSGCAVLGKKSAGSGLTDREQAATYNEVVVAESVDQYSRSQCPSSDWENNEWRKLVAQAGACVKAQDWSKVEKIGRHLAIHAHTTPWGGYFLSLAAAAQKNYPRAQWMLELALKKAPREGILHYQLGRVYWEMGQETLAIKELTLASDLNPSLVDAHVLVAALAVNRQDYSSAVYLYARALKVDQKHWPAIMGLASVKMKRGDWKEAEDLFDQSVKLNPRSARARLALAQVREQHLKKLSEALQSYRELKTLATENKLDEGLRFNLDEKIQSLEKSLSQAQKVNQVTVRQPANEKKVSK